MVFNNCFATEMNKQKEALFSTLLCACMYADRGEWENKRTKVGTLYLQFVKLLDQVQHFPDTVDCSCLLLGIKLVYIVVAGMFSTIETDWYLYVIWKSNLLVLFYAKHIDKFISKASSCKLLMNLNDLQQCCFFLKVLTKGRTKHHKVKRMWHIRCQKAR